MHPTVVLIINFLMSLSLLIVLHELGHFIPARLFKTRVEKFYLFFDIKYSLFKKKIGETVYGIGWLPLGGYVKISGMIDESMDKEQMAQEPKEWEFRSKPAWQRLIIMLGGVIVNVVLGFVIYIGLIAYNGTNEASGADFKYGFGFPETLEEVGFRKGDQILLIDQDTIDFAPTLNQKLIFRDIETVTVLRNGEKVEVAIPEDIGSRMFEAGVSTSLEARVPFTVDSVVVDSKAYKIGIKDGSKIISVAGYPIEFNTDYSYAMNHKVKHEEPFEVVWEYNGERYNKEVTFTTIEKKTFFFFTKEVDEPKVLGIIKKPTEKGYAKVTRKQYSFSESISAGISRGYWTMHDYIVQFKYVFTAKGASQLGGFGTIAKLYPDTFDWTAFWATTAFISFILAIMNILPIPALDGGHVMFLLYEIITGRKPGDKFLERAQIIGIVILLSLMLYANGNDLFKALFG
ncbi:regulator of sigma E protease [Nonlabens dokdonensis]|nr:regulator of sigma E protease [Nonlabens dokdonensis]